MAKKKCVAAKKTRRELGKKQWLTWFESGGEKCFDGSLRNKKEAVAYAEARALPADTRWGAVKLHEEDFVVVGERSEDK